MAASDIATFANTHEAFGIAVDAQRLNLLDDLWTSYSDIRWSSSERDDDEVELRAIVGEMRGLLASLESRVPTLQRLIEAIGPEAVDQALNTLLSETPQGDEVRRTLDSKLAGYSFADAARQACIEVVEDVPAEIALLDERLDEMLERTAAGGDLKLPFKCKATLVAAVGFVIASTLLGVMTGLPLGVPLVGGLVGALAGLTGATFAIASNCPDELLELIARGGRPPAQA